MKMRELEARTGVSREIIRVLFREGLLPPVHRPARNVADYGEEHVRAIAAVRDLKDKSGLTLPQIKAAISGKDHGLHIGAGALAQLDALVASRLDTVQGTVSLQSLRVHNPAADSDARTLADLGVIEIVHSPSGPQISITDSGLLSIWARMRAAGFDEDHGFPPDILDFYVRAAEFVASNETRLFLERVQASVGADEAVRMLTTALPAMLDFFGILRQKAFLEILRQRTAHGHRVSRGHRPGRGAGQRQGGSPRTAGVGAGT